MSSRALKSQRAFTLIEVMLAFALLALMLLILYGSFALSTRAEEKVAVRVNANERIRAVEGLLAGYIRSAYPYRVGGGGGIAFSGTEEKLSFVSALSVLSGDRGLANVTITFTTDEEGNGVLKLQESVPVRLGTSEAEDDGDVTNEAQSPERSDAQRGSITDEIQQVESGGEENGGITNEVILAEKLTSARISYLEVTDDIEEWLSDWDGSQQGRLPKAVRIILEAQGAEPAEWVFPIMIRVLTVS